MLLSCNFVHKNTYFRRKCNKSLKMKIFHLFVVLLFINVFSIVDARSQQHNHYHIQQKDEVVDALTASKLNVYPEQQFPGKLHRSQFPEGFVFGSAGSAYQVA